MTDFNNLLTRKELADELGVSVPTIDKWKANKGLPYVKSSLNGHVRFNLDDVRQWLESDYKRVR